MSRIFHLLFLALSLALTACSDITEEVWIQADGSGRQEYQFDLSSMYPFIGMSLSNSPTLQTERPDTLSDKDRMAFNMVKLLDREKLDTTISMRGLFAQIAATQGMSIDDLMQKLEEGPEDGEDGPTTAQLESIRQVMNIFLGVDFRIQSDRDKAKLNLSMISRFNSTDSTLVKSMTNMLTSMSDELEGKLPPGVGNIQEMFSGNILYDLDGKTLRVERKAYNQKMLENEEMGAEGLQMMKAFMGQINYRLVIHLPGKVRKVSGAEAEIDGDQVTLVIPYSDMTDPDKNWDIAIKFR